MIDNSLSFSFKKKNSYILEIICKPSVAYVSSSPLFKKSHFISITVSCNGKDMLKALHESRSVPGYWLSNSRKWLRPNNLTSLDFLWTDRPRLFLAISSNFPIQAASLDSSRLCSESNLKSLLQSKGWQSEGPEDESFQRWWVTQARSQPHHSVALGTIP